MCSTGNDRRRGSEVVGENNAPADDTETTRKRKRTAAEGFIIRRAGRAGAYKATKIRRSWPECENRTTKGYTPSGITGRASGIKRRNDGSNGYLSIAVVVVVVYSAGRRARRRNRGRTCFAVHARLDQDGTWADLRVVSFPSGFVRQTGKS